MVTKNARLAAKAQAIAEAQAAKDRDLLEALGKRDTAPAVAPKPSLGDNFVSVAAMIAQASKDTHIAHVNLVKIWELTLMWELNNRNQPQQPVFDHRDLVDVGSGEEGESEPDDPPTTADEMIGEFTELPQETPNE